MNQATAEKLLSDRMWRLTHLYDIKRKDNTVGRLVLNNVQKRYLAEMTQNDVLLKSRQSGFTTLNAIELLDDTIWSPGTTSFLQYPDDKKQKQAWDIIDRAFSSMPDGLRPRVKYANRGELTFPDIDSKIIVTLDARGGTPTNVLLDEFAFHLTRERQQDCLNGVVPAWNKVGRLLMQSTPNGIEYFHDRYMQAKSNGWKIGQKAHFYDWLLDPTCKMPVYPGERVEYDSYGHAHRLTPEQMKFRNVQIGLLNSEKMFEQEYPVDDVSCFLVSGSAIFNLEVIQAMLDEAKAREHQRVQYEAGRAKLEPRAGFVWKQWKERAHGHRYVFGGDVGHGVTGGDYSACSVYDADERELVALFRSRVDPDEFARQIIEANRYWEPERVAVEVNDYGYAVNKTLRESGDVNLHVHERWEKMDNTYTSQVGWLTDGKSRPRLIMRAMEMFRTRGWDVPSVEILEEAQRFVRKDGGREEHEDGFNDDGLFSLMIAEVVADEVRAAPRRSRERFDDEELRAVEGLMEGSTIH